MGLSVVVGFCRLRLRRHCRHLRLRLSAEDSFHLRSDGKKLQGKGEDHGEDVQQSDHGCGKDLIEVLLLLS